MTYETFCKCMDLIRAWREKNQRGNWEWPDSRDPAFRDMITEFKVVPQEVEKSIIALAAWRHGHEDVYQGMSAIAKVIVNRQIAGLFRSHTTDAFQFERMADPVDGFLDVYPPKEFNFEELLRNIDDILDSKVVDLTQNAQYFGVVQSGMDEWFQEIVKTKTRTVKIGSKTFFKDPKGL